MVNHPNRHKSPVQRQFYEWWISNAGPWGFFRDVTPSGVIVAEGRTGRGYRLPDYAPTVAVHLIDDKWCLCSVAGPFGYEEPFTGIIFDAGPVTYPSRRCFGNLVGRPAWWEAAEPA